LFGRAINFGEIGSVGDTGRLRCAILNGGGVKLVGYVGTTVVRVAVRVNGIRARS
jgi:hypothetical protein